MEIFEQEVLARLIEDRVVDRKKMVRHQKDAEREGRPLTVELMEAGVVDRSQILAALAQVSGLPAFDLKNHRISPTAAQMISKTMAESLKVLPVAQDSGRLHVAMADPTDIGALHRVMNVTGRECQPMVIYAPDLPEAIERTHSVKVERIGADTPSGPEAGAGRDEKPRGRFIVATRATRYEGDQALKNNLARSLGSEPVKISLEPFVTSRAAPMGTPTSPGEARFMLEQSLLHLTDEGSEGERIRTLLRVADRLCMAEASSLLLLSEDGRELCFVEATGERAHAIRGRRLPLDENSLAGYSFLHRQTLKVVNAEEDPRQHRATDDAIGFRTRTLVSCPVFLDGDPCGVLEVVNKTGGAFTGDDVEVIQILAAQASLAVAASRQSAFKRTAAWQVVNGFRTMLEETGVMRREQGELVHRMALEMGRDLRLGEGALEGLRMASYLYALGQGSAPGKPSPRLAGLQQMGLVRAVLPCLLHCQERFDGTGVPEGLSGDRIPQGARILAVAGAWIDGLQKLGAEAQDKVAAEIEAGFGTRFDPGLQESFRRAIERVSPPVAVPA